MTDWPSISIVTPSYNQAPFLETTIRSVLDQGYPNLQYGVIDGQSTDGSAKIIEHYRDQLDFAVVEPDNGQSEAINKGMRMVGGEIVGYLNSDDTLLPGSLEVIGEHFAQHPDCMWLIGACRGIDEKGQPVKKMHPSGRFTPEGILLRKPGELEIPQPSVFWRRRLFPEVGLFDENLHYTMDFDLWCRLVCAGYEPEITDVELATYRFHEQSKSVTSSANFVEEHLTVEARYRKHLSPAGQVRHWRRSGYVRRILAIGRGRDHLLRQVIRHPWWLGSQQVRQVLFRLAA
jgi:glycosyltransferase involved in cell wall biosynthesis